MTRCRIVLLPRQFSTKLNQEATVREAAEVDFAEIWGVFRSAQKEGRYTANARENAALDAYYRALLSDSGKRRLITLVAQVQGKTVGYLTIEESIWDISQHVGELGIAVLSEFRGIGIGAALLESAIDEAPKKGFKKIELSVFHNNKRAMKLYNKFGFKKVGRKKSQFNVNGEYVDEIIMERFIG
ncbi:MAG: GNAT family N-acetyltransferase [Candidatus Atabeyarchaeum deiterrae]